MKKNCKFIFGNVYFRLHFLDVKYEFPIIDSLVYIGKNIERNESKNNHNIDLELDMWYFQEIKSYLNIGAYDGKVGVQFSNKNDEYENIVYDFNENMLDEIKSALELSILIKNHWGQSI